MTWMVSALLLCVATPVAAESYYATPTNYRAKLQQLRPGDMLLLAPGLYRDGLPLHGMEGKPGQPIRIEGDASGAGTVFLGRPGANTVSIKNSAYLVLRSLVLDGANMPVDAVKAEGTSAYAHHITLERLVIVNHGVDQQVVGISTKCPAWNWTIRDNEIHGAGTGLYLGDSDGTAPFVGGLIEGNLIVNTVGYNLQIKHQLERPRIMPGETMRTVIRHNVFSKAKGGASGSMARPNVLLGHFPMKGQGAEDEYEVYGNFFYDNPSESLLQAEGNLSIHENIFVNNHGDAVRIQPHHAEPRRVSLTHNTILAKGTGISIKGGGVLHRQTVLANAVFAGMPLQGGNQRWNVIAAFMVAGEMLEAPYTRLGQLDYSPRDRQLDLPAAIDESELPANQRDFYGRVRSYPSAGAIAPGIPAPWFLGLSRRPITH